MGASAGKEMEEIGPIGRIGRIGQIGRITRPPATGSRLLVPARAYWLLTFSSLR